MLDDCLTLLDGTEVISLRGVTKITGSYQQARELLILLKPEASLDGEHYFDRVEVERVVAASR